MLPGLGAPSGGMVDLVVDEILYLHRDEKPFFLWTLRQEQPIVLISEDRELNSRGSSGSNL